MPPFHNFQHRPPYLVGVNAGYLAYDSSMGEIFSTNGVAANTVSVISDSTNAVVANVTVGDDPLGIAYDAGKGEMFVVDHGAYADNGNPASTVSVISDSTNTVVASIPIGNNAQSGIAYDAGKGDVFVANLGGGVSVISDSSNTVVATINVGTDPYGVAYDSAKGEIFVSNEQDSSVSVISDSTNAVVATVTGSIRGPEGLAYDSAKGEVFVADYPASSFSVISDKTNAVVTTVAMDQVDPYSGNPGEVSYNSATGNVFISCAGAVQMVSDTNNEVVGYIRIVGLGFTHDSGKGEEFMSGNGVISILSDSSSPSSSSSPTSPSVTSTVSASSTPTVPEFSNAILASLVAVILVVTFAVAAVRRNKPKKMDAVLT